MSTNYEERTLTARHRERILQGHVVSEIEVDCLVAGLTVSSVPNGLPYSVRMHCIQYDLIPQQFLDVYSTSRHRVPRDN